MRTVLAVLASVFVLLGSVDAQRVSIVSPDGSTEAADVFAHASNELRKYVKSITGQDASVVEAKSFDVTSLATGDVVFAVGSPAQNALSAKIESDAGKRCPVAALIPEHNDAFVIRSWRDVKLGKFFELEQESPSYVILAGKTPIATLYATYHYLDHVCGVGFFEDGERIPMLARMPAEEILIIEEPRFDARLQLPWAPRATLPKGVSSLWRADVEWKEYLDWMVKNKWNWMRIDAGDWWYQGLGIMYKSYPEIAETEQGGYMPIQWWPLETVFQNTKKVLDRGRFLGIKCYMTPISTSVPTTYGDLILKRFPEAQLSNPDPVYKFAIHMRDLRTIEKFFRHNTEVFYKHFGKPDMQGAQFPPVELDPFIEAGTKFLPDRSNLMAKVSREYDPEAAFLIDGWAVAMRYFQKPEKFKELVDSLDYNYTFNSAYSSREPMYWRFDYFWGKPWHYHDITSFGGNDHLHVIIPFPDLLARAKDISSNPNSNCIGFGNMDELLGNDALLRFVYCRLSWNPFKYHTWNDLLVEYTFRRYGPEAFSNMYESHDQLTQALFAQPQGTLPVQGFTPVHKHPTDALLAFTEVQAHWQYYVHGENFGRVDNSLRAALQEAERFDGDELYESYLSSVFTTYASEVFKFALLRCYSGYFSATQQFQVSARSLGTIPADGPKLEAAVELFESEAKKMDACLVAIEDVWSTRPELSTERYVKNTMSVPGANPGMAARIRKDSVIWDDGAYETMAQYYRPRVQIFLDDLRRRIDEKETELFDAKRKVAANLDDFGARIFEVHTWVNDKRIIEETEKLIEKYLAAPIHVEPRVRASTTQVVLRSLKALDELGCSLAGYADMATTEMIGKNYPLNDE